MIENKGRMGLRSRYSDEFMDRALAMIEACGSVNQVARELGVGRSILYRWKDNAAKAAPADPGTRGPAADGAAAADCAELRRLRKEVARLELENDILKKAAVILGSDASSKRGV